MVGRRRIFFQTTFLSFGIETGGNAENKEKNGISPLWVNSCCFMDKFDVYYKIVISSKGHKII